MDLCSLIDRNAAFAPDKTAIAFEGERLSYAALAARIERTATALKQELGVGRGDRVAILSLNRPDYLVLLYACARLGAMLVPLNWRLAVAEQRFILTDAGAKVLVLEQAFAGVLPELAPGTAVIGLDFAPSRGVTFEDLLARSEGSGRNPHTDLSCPLLVVYTSGTTGRPKGAVLRQEALFWNGVMSQHMQNMTSDDHVLTVLPFFHVGGLNIQTTPALQLGATVTIHARFTPDTALAAIERERPTLTVMVPAILQAVSEHPAWTTPNRSLVAQGRLDRLDHRATAPDRSLRGARCSGASGLWFDGNLPHRNLHPAWRRSFARGIDRTCRPVLRSEGDRSGRQ
ncbi:acyl-CoA synthetase (AMP-forming)/AMP-acid ligase II [Bradyrhizobium sp. i1.3.6]